MHDEKQQHICTIAAEFAENVIKPQASYIDQHETMPKEIIDGLASYGLLGAVVPTEYGGLGMDPFHYGLLTETIGKVCSSTRTLLTVHTSLVCETMMKWATQSQKEHYLHDLATGKKIGAFALSEQQSGSDANSLRTQYESKANKFILNGEKKWISFAEIADIFIVFAKENEQVSAFIVERDTPGLEITPMRGLLGSRGTHMAKVSFTDVEVSSDHLLGRAGMGFSFVANNALFYGRYSIAWAGLSIAQASLEEMVKYARKREQFDRKIGQHQLVKGMIADSVTEIHAARSLCYTIGKLRNNHDEKAIMETNIAKYFTSKVACNVASNAVQVFGGNGCLNEYPVERFYRDAKILEIIEGTSQIQQVIIANDELKKYRK